jgi:hypothetical protein
MIIAALVMSALALAASAWVVLAVLSASWYVNAEHLERLDAGDGALFARVVHLEKAIKQCWPTFKAYGESHDNS